MCAASTAKRRRRQLRQDKRYAGARRDAAARSRKEQMKAEERKARDARKAQKGSKK